MHLFKCITCTTSFSQSLLGVTSHIGVFGADHEILHLQAKTLLLFFLPSGVNINLCCQNSPV